MPTRTPIELLSVDARIERLDEIAKQLTETLRAHGAPMELSPLLQAVAAQAGCRWLRCTTG